MLKVKQMRVHFLVFSLLFATFAYGQTTLPPNVFPIGSQQTPLAVNAATTQKQGAYGYLVVSGVPQKNADTLTNKNSSTLRLFELWPDGSAKELKPAHSLNSNIRALGGGRFSHWHDTNISSYILFSTSDATDPRSNGRSYLAVQPSAAATGDRIGSIYDRQTNTRKYYLGTSDPQHRTVVISNPSNHTYAFGVAFNQNGFLQSSADLRAEIRNGIPAFIGEPIERKVWRFVSDNRRYGVPYSEQRWQHHPLLMFNSVGWGICDDDAAVLMHTAALFGIRTRVWGLHGHVVPEVYTNGRWHLYDPTYKTYFIDSTVTRNVASVSELVSNTSLITAPLLSAPWTPIKSSLVGRWGSATNYASLYSPDDAPTTWYNYLPVAEAPLRFDLPPGGAVEIGAHGPSDAPTTFDEGVMAHQTAYSSVKVSLPQGSVGALQVFLAPYKIKGSGTATLYFLDGLIETIPISSDWNIYNTYYRNSYINRISYTAGKGGMAIYYLANPIRSSVRGFNSIVLKPSSTMPAGVANPLSVRLRQSG